MNKKIRFYKIFIKLYKIKVIKSCVKFIYKKKKIQERKDKKIKRGGQLRGYSGRSLCFTFSFGLLDDSGVRGGGKCPEEEHTTCSGGPRINSHKRGLRGEREKSEKKKNKIFFKKENIL
jgi:hypothetical protein